MSILTLEAKLERVEPSTPWGFRMQGGKEFGCPLTILRVNPGSLASKCGLQQGDIILRIGKNETEQLKHKEAQDCILSSGNKLDLLLQRDIVEQYVDKSSDDVDQGGSVQQPTYEKFATPTITPSYQQSPAGTPTGGSQNYNQVAKPFGSTPNATSNKPSYDANVNAVTQQTQNISFSPKPVTNNFQSAAQKYADSEDKPPTSSQQSRSFRYLKDIIDSGQEPPAPQQQSPPWRDQPPPPPAPPAQQVRPAPAAPAAPAAPKPGVWIPPSGPASKPFSPSVNPPVAPPAPGGPQGGPPKPTGVGAVRGKRGEAAIFKSGDSAPGGARIPMCASCGSPIRGPFVVALGKTWCPDHFVCANPRCAIKLLDIGFVEEGGYLYCEKDYEQYFAPHCAKCGKAIVGECVNALQKTFHPGCFLCHQCNQPIGGNQFHLEDGKAYCENDWRQMFQTMCKSCNFPIEPGDHWIEAMGSNFHSECFNCSTCQVNLEGQPFFAKAGKPYCKKHAR